MKNCPAPPAPAPKVSVIIPVYNTEAYLEEALDSICNQTLTELEIILVNDGSTDNSQAIIEEYARKDGRISCQCQPNQGQGVARNNGLQAANGTYIYFMDSDDILETDALRQCYEACEKNQLDFVTFDAKSFPEDSHLAGKFNYCRKGRVDEQKIWDGMELMKHELEHEVFFVTPWLCFARHSFLKEHFTGFPSNAVHEDNIFIVQIMLSARRAGYLPQAFFRRRIRPDSTMTTRFSMRDIEGYTTICTRIRGWIQQHKEWEPCIRLYLTLTLESVIWLGHQLTWLEKIETFCRFRRLRLSAYVAFRYWMVFWFKRRERWERRN